MEGVEAVGEVGAEAYEGADAEEGELHAGGEEGPRGEDEDEKGGEAEGVEGGVAALHYQRSHYEGDHHGGADGGDVAAGDEDVAPGEQDGEGVTATAQAAEHQRGGEQAYQGGDDSGVETADGEDVADAGVGEYLAEVGGEHVAVAEKHGGDEGFRRTLQVAVFQGYVYVVADFVTPCEEPFCGCQLGHLSPADVDAPEYPLPGEVFHIAVVGIVGVVFYPLKGVVEHYPVVCHEMVFVGGGDGFYIMEGPDGIPILVAHIFEVEDGAGAVGHASHLFHLPHHHHRQTVAFEVYVLGAMIEVDGKACRDSGHGDYGGTPPAQLPPYRGSTGSEHGSDNPQSSRHPDQHGAYPQGQQQDVAEDADGEGDGGEETGITLEEL